MTRVEEDAVSEGFDMARMVMMQFRSWRGKIEPRLLGVLGKVSKVRSGNGTATASLLGGGGRSADEADEIVLIGRFGGQVVVPLDVHVVAGVHGSVRAPSDRSIAIKWHGGVDVVDITWGDNGGDVVEGFPEPIAEGDLKQHAIRIALLVKTVAGHAVADPVLREVDGHGLTGRQVGVGNCLLTGLGNTHDCAILRILWHELDIAIGGGDCSSADSGENGGGELHFAEE